MLLLSLLLLAAAVAVCLNARDQTSFPAVVFAATFLPVLLELSLGLVFVEFDSERLGDGWHCEKAQDTECGCGVTNSSRMSCAVFLVACTPKKEQPTLAHVDYYCEGRNQG